MKAGAIGGLFSISQSWLEPPVGATPPRRNCRSTGRGSPAEDRQPALPGSGPEDHPGSRAPEATGGRPGLRGRPGAAPRAGHYRKRPRRAVPCRRSPPRSRRLIILLDPGPRAGSRDHTRGGVGRISTDPVRCCRNGGCRKCQGDPRFLGRFVCRQAPGVVQVPGCVVSGLTPGRAGPAASLHVENLADIDRLTAPQGEGGFGRR